MTKNREILDIDVKKVIYNLHLAAQDAAYQKLGSSLINDKQVQIVNSGVSDQDKNFSANSAIQDFFGGNVYEVAIYCQFYNFKYQKDFTDINTLSPENKKAYDAIKKQIHEAFKEYFKYFCNEKIPQSIDEITEFFPYLDGRNMEVAYSNSMSCFKEMNKKDIKSYREQYEDDMNYKPIIAFKVGFIYTDKNKSGTVQYKPST